jgi:hypothetical protein
MSGADPLGHRDRGGGDVDRVGDASGLLDAFAARGADPVPIGVERGRTGSSQPTWTAWASGLSLVPAQHRVLVPPGLSAEFAPAVLRAPAAGR